MGNCAGSNSNPEKGFNKPKPISPKQASAIQQQQSNSKSLDKPEGTPSHHDFPSSQKTSQPIQKDLNEAKNTQSDIDPPVPPSSQPPAINLLNAQKIPINPQQNPGNLDQNKEPISKISDDQESLSQLYPSLSELDEKAITKNSNIKKSGSDINKIEVDFKNTSSLYKSNQNGHLLQYQSPKKFDEDHQSINQKQCQTKKESDCLQKNRSSAIPSNDEQLNTSKGQEQIYKETFRQYGQTTVDHPDRISVTFLKCDNI